MASHAPAAARKVTAFTIPATMSAAAIDRFGKPEALRLHTLPVPEVGEHDVLIAMHAAGVGIWDAKIRSGEWATGKEKFPLILGTDGAGIVVAKGSRVRRFDIGDRVWAYHFGKGSSGFYAEYVAVAANYAALAPRRLDLQQAGAGAVTGLTALQGIHDALRVGRNQRVLIFGATGAVGALAVQFARRKRAHVIATATGRAATAMVNRLGAEDVIDARNNSAIDRLEDIAPDGLDAVLACAGGEGLERCLEHLRPDGKLAYPNGVEPEPRKRRRFRVISYDAMAGPREFERLARAVAGARLRVPIAASYALSQAARAHARLEEGHVRGRIVLRIRRS